MNGHWAAIKAAHGEKVMRYSRTSGNYLTVVDGMLVNEHGQELSWGVFAYASALDDWAIFEEPWLSVGDTIRWPDGNAYGIVYANNEIALGIDKNYKDDVLVFRRSNLAEQCKKFDWTITRAKEAKP